MKLIEKLAAQAVDRAQEQMLQNPHMGPDLSVASAYHYVGFIEGFRACRELAMAVMNSGGCLCGRDEWCEQCSPSSGFNRIRSEVSTLGEAEVP